MTTRPLSPLTMLLSRHTRRREFITLLGGAAAAWPLAARAQQVERVRRIGLLMGTADDQEGQARVTALKQGLQELGWTDGRNIQIETRFGGADAGRIRAHAAELVALAPDVLVVIRRQVPGRCGRRPVPFPSLWWRSTIPSSKASFRAWRIRVGTSLASRSSISKWWGSGWRCSKRPPPAFLALHSCSTRTRPLLLRLPAFI